MREYSRTQTVVANPPCSVMLLAGAAAIAWGFDFSGRAMAGAAGYLAYGVGGALWIMVFVCRYCGYHGTRGWPCGYGMLSARLARKGGQECFAAKFKRHIPVIVPLWLIPVVCGAAARLWRVPAKG